MASGEAIFSPGAAQHVMDYFAHPPLVPVKPAALSQLSEREREVLTLIAQGLACAC
jgi:DNA-binding NarL/FixJ family response regulator